MNSYIGEDIKMTDEELFKKDCGGYDYIPTIIGVKKRVIAIGDLHGDFELLIRCLKIGGVINEKNEWIGKDTHVVQIGDQVDSCRPTSMYSCNDKRAMKYDKAEDVKILKYLTELNTQARKSEGRVISLLGNHELKVVKGDMGYVSYENIREFDDYKDPSNPEMKFNSGLEARTHAFKPGNEYGNFLGCTRQSVVVIGSNIFVHGGIVPNYLIKAGIHSQEDLRLLNSIVRKYLLGLIKGAKIEDLIFGSSESVFWNRIYGTLAPKLKSEDEEVCEKYLNKVLRILNVGSMIIGHTIQFTKNNEGVNSTCDDKVHRIDFGGSHGFDVFDNSLMSGENKLSLREAQILLIEDDKKYKVIKMKN
jgi:hypothetical protein